MKMHYSSWFVLFSTIAMPLTTTLECTAARGIFAKYPNQYFIETGSYLGDGIQMAVEAGFPQIYSIELSTYFYQHCLDRFTLQPQVHILQGDSSKMLINLLDQIDAPATFWLDGHYSWGNTAMGDTNTPILTELRAIGEHHIKTHTLLIDDIRQCGTMEFDFIELQTIIDEILKINPRYKISFEDGYVTNDVLVAKVEET